MSKPNINFYCSVYVERVNGMQDSSSSSALQPWVGLGILICVNTACIKKSVLTPRLELAYLNYEEC